MNNTGGLKPSKPLPKKDQRKCPPHSKHPHPQPQHRHHPRSMPNTIRSFEPLTAMQQLLKIKATALICQRILNAIHIKLVLDEIQAESGPAIAPIRDQNDPVEHGVGLLQIIPGTFSDHISEPDIPHLMRPYKFGGTLPARTAPQLDRDINEPWGNITIDDINRCLERFTKKESNEREKVPSH